MRHQNHHTIPNGNGKMVRPWKVSSHNASLFNWLPLPHVSVKTVVQVTKLNWTKGNKSQNNKNAARWISPTANESPLSILAITAANIVTMMAVTM